MKMKKWVSFILALCLLGGCASRTEKPTEEMASDIETVSLADKDPEESMNPSSALQKEQQVASAAENVAPIGSEGAASDLLPSDSLQKPSPDSQAEWALRLVNYENGLPQDFEPELVEVQGIYKMDARVAQTVKQMISDAQAQGVSLLVCSAYRPHSSQQRNFDSSVNRYIQAGYSRDKAVTQTKLLIAEPGKSEHQTGLAVDIVTPSYQSLDDGFAETEAAKWLAKHAPEYGFILRYPKDKTEITKISFEPWHFRYVGVEAAKQMTEQGLCLEEYLG